MEGSYPSPGGVSDLAISSTTSSTVTLTWTDLDDGRDTRYRVKYAEPPIDWDAATLGCESVEAPGAGARISCTVEELDSESHYDFLLMSHQRAGSTWARARYSNIVSASTAAEGAPADSTSPDDPRSDSTAADPAGIVSDLAIDASTASSATLSWTEVDDGTGEPALYQVRYATPALDDWSTATIGCGPSIEGIKVGAPISCTVEGLASATTYDVQLVSYRSEDDGSWVGTQHSNIVTVSTAASAGDSDPGAISDGIWIDRNELKELPTSGAAWDRLHSHAGRTTSESADISDQDSHHDVYTMAAALVCARTGEYCREARAAVVDAIGTELGGRWLAVGRNLASYVIAADLLDLRADGNSSSAGTRVEEWIEGWLTREVSDNNSSTLRGFRPFGGSANAMAQEGLAYAAVAAYLQDDWALQRAWDAFRTFACDPTAPDREGIYLVKSVADGWAHDDDSPCAINPYGTTKRVPSGVPGAGSVRRIDGALTGDMRRGGTYQWEPGYTQYAWVGLEGFVPAAVILDRAGYPAFDVADRAVLRTHEYLLYLARETGDQRWFDGDRAREVVYLVNAAYGTSFPLNGTVGRGRTVGYTDWTHSRW